MLSFCPSTSVLTSPGMHTCLFRKADLNIFVLFLFLTSQIVKILVIFLYMLKLFKFLPAFLPFSWSRLVKSISLPIFVQVCRSFTSTGRADGAPPKYRRYFYRLCFKVIYSANVFTVLSTCCTLLSGEPIPSPHAGDIISEPFA